MQVQTFESRFLPGVYRAAVVAGCLVSAVLAAVGIEFAVGFAAAGALSVLLLAVQQRTVKAFLAPQGPRAVKKFACLSFLKYLVVFAVIGLLLRHLPMNPFAFCTGFLLVPAAICFEAAMMVSRCHESTEARKI